LCDLDLMRSRMPAARALGKLYYLEPPWRLSTAPDLQVRKRSATHQPRAYRLSAEYLL